MCHVIKYLGALWLPQVLNQGKGQQCNRVRGECVFQQVHPVKLRPPESRTSTEGPPIVPYHNQIRRLRHFNYINDLSMPQNGSEGQKMAKFVFSPFLSLKILHDILNLE